jgi:hypothetical protein
MTGLTNAPVRNYRFLWLGKALNSQDYKRADEKMNTENNRGVPESITSWRKRARESQNNCKINSPKSSYDSPSMPPAVPAPETYLREYSVFQRLYKLFLSPSDAMKDIGLAPDYGGPIFLVILKTVLGVTVISVAFEKFQLVGDSQLVSQVWGFVSLVLTIAAVISIFIYVAYWVVKSFLVKYMCDGGSNWSFATAASVTGYAYIADVVIGIVAFIIIYPLIPTLTINVSNLDAARQAVANFRSQYLGTALAVGIPTGLVGIIWKSYLGGLGTKSGTKERCKLSWGFTAFFILALLGWLISYLLTGNV